MSLWVLAWRLSKASPLFFAFAEFASTQILHSQVDGSRVILTQVKPLTPSATDLGSQMQVRGLEAVVENRSHAGCAWIVDQLIAIREMEQKLIAAFEVGDQRAKMRFRFRLAELNRWLDKLDKALENYGSPVGLPADVARRGRAAIRSQAV